MLDLGRADAVRQGTESAVGRGVAVAADNGHARQGEALLRPDDVDDALADIACRIIFDAEIGRVLGKRFHLDAAFLILDAEMAIRRGRDVVIDNGQSLLRRTHGAVGHAQTLERLRARHFVDEMAIDVEKTGAVILLADQVVVPDFIVEGTRCAHGCASILKKEIRKTAGQGAPETRSGLAPRKLAKSAVERAGDACKKACRQTLVVLQHDDILR